MQGREKKRNLPIPSITGMCISPHAIPVGLFLAVEWDVKSTESYPRDSLSCGGSASGVRNGNLLGSHCVALSRKGHKSYKKLTLSTGPVLRIYIN